MKGGLDALRQIIRDQEPLRPSTKLNTLPGEARTTAGKRRQTEVEKLVHQLQGDLDWIVMKCLEKDRMRRYDTANGLAMDIQRHLANEPVVARPPSAAYKFQKAWQRNKLAFTAGAAVALALVVGTGVSTWQAVVATRAKSVSVEAQAKAEAEQQRADIQARKASASEQQARRLLYASDMNLAQQSLTLNNLGKARRLLDRQRPQPGADDLRGWEWRYLWQQTRSGSLATLTNRSLRGFSTSFSPDGNFLAVGWYDGAVDLWDVPTRRRIRALTDGGQLPPGRVVFSPARNLLVATSGHKGVMLYDLDAQQEKLVWKPDDAPLFSVPDMAFSRDGSKLAIYARVLPTNSAPGDGVWVINTASLKIESHYKTIFAALFSFGAVQLSPDGRHLYMARSDSANSRYSIQCVDLTTGQQVWENEPHRDKGLTALALSADGRLLASGSGYEDPAIRVWDASNGRFLVRLDGHTAWVNELVFGGTGGQLISAAADQTIRFWDTNNWTETRVLRGHADEVQTIAIAEAAKLVASASKDGDLMLWKEDGAGTGIAYRRLPEGLGYKGFLPLDQSKALLLHRSKPPELVDLRQDSAPMPFPEIISTNVLGHPGDDNILCDWNAANGSNEIRVREWREGKFDLLGTVRLDSSMRPATCAYNPKRHLLAWTTGGPTASVYLANITEPGRRIEFKSDLRGLDFLSFTEDGNYLSFGFERDKWLRIWDVETRRTIISLNERVRYWAFAPGNHRVAFAVEDGLDHEIRFYDLANPNTILKRYSGKHFPGAQAESNELMAFSSGGGQISLFASATGELIDTVHGHGSSVFGLGFSPDGQRLISSAGGREAVKLWDVSTRQELLTLAGTGSILVRAKFSADGNVILAGPPWQAWTAPSWEEIARAEAKEKTPISQP
jgi:eukaryotic-like serine/threonine-protein kinase